MTANTAVRRHAIARRKSGGVHGHVSDHPGIASIVIGTLAVGCPAYHRLACRYSADAMIDGITNPISGVSPARAGGRSWAYVVQGPNCIGAGVPTFLRPCVTALAHESVIAAWAVVTGGAEIAAAIKPQQGHPGRTVVARTARSRSREGARVCVSGGRCRRHGVRARRLHNRGRADPRHVCFGVRSRRTVANRCMPGGRLRSPLAAVDHTSVQTSGKPRRDVLPEGSSNCFRRERRAHSL